MPNQLQPMQPVASHGRMLEPGTVDLYGQPEVQNPDGTTSTVHSFSVNFDGREYLLPTVTPDGRHLSEEDAIEEFQRTGLHLGVFSDPEAATAYASQLHDDYAQGKYRVRPMASHPTSIREHAALFGPKGRR